MLHMFKNTYAQASTEFISEEPHLAQRNRNKIINTYKQPYTNMQTHRAFHLLIH